MSIENIKNGNSNEEHKKPELSGTFVGPEKSGFVVGNTGLFEKISDKKLNDVIKEIQSYIESSEKALSNFDTGRISPENISHVLDDISYIYNNLNKEADSIIEIIENDSKTGSADHFLHLADSLEELSDSYQNLLKILKKFSIIEEKEEKNGMSDSRVYRDLILSEYMVSQADFSMLENRMRFIADTLFEREDLANNKKS